MRYRLIFRDRISPLVDRFEFLAPSDAVAEHVVEELVSTPDKELWAGRRLVKVWERPQVEYRVH